MAAPSLVLPVLAYVCESIVWLRNRAPQFLNFLFLFLPWLCPFWLVCESIVWLRNRAPQFLNLLLPLLPWLCPFWLVCESTVWLRNRAPQFLNLILPLLPWLCPFWLGSLWARPCEIIPCCARAPKLSGWRKKKDDRFLRCPVARGAQFLIFNFAIHITKLKNG